MPRRESTHGRSAAHADDRHTDASDQRRAISPALAVPRPASVSVRTSSVEEVLGGRRAACARSRDGDLAAELTKGSQGQVIQTER
jgi:hypothetical protein